MTNEKSQGRQDPEKIVKDDFRMQFQHDRDRTTSSVLDSPDFPRLEADINNLLYAFFGLTPEEIAIVEGKNAVK